MNKLFSSVVLACACIVFAGCNTCGGLWFQNCPTPGPTPIASPTPLVSVATPTPILTPIPTVSPIDYFSPTPTVKVATPTPIITRSPTPASTKPFPTATVGGASSSPTPKPTATVSVPSPTPVQSEEFGKIMAIYPSAINGSAGSIDFKYGTMFEYCRGTPKLFLRNVADGHIVGEIQLDSRCNDLWAVCWDMFRLCYWGTNPDFTNFEDEQCNFLKIRENGELEGWWRVSDNWDKPALDLRDCDTNEFYSYTDTDGSGNYIRPKLIMTADWHYSLRKVDYIDPDNNFWEQWWCRLDISHGGETRTGNTYWAACDKDNPENGQWPLIEFKQTNRKLWAERTGRKIVVAGTYFTSLKTDGRYIWGKGINGKNSNIYKISLGLGPVPTPIPITTRTPVVAIPSPTRPFPTKSPTASPIPTSTPTDPDAGTYEDIPFSATLGNSTIKSISIDKSKKYVYITGSTTDGNLLSDCINKDVYKATYPGASSVYLMKFAPDGKKLRGTYVSTGNGQGVTVDTEGNIAIGGGVSDDNWPTKNAYQESRKGTTPNCYLAKIDSALKYLFWSTYIGGGLHNCGEACPDGTSIKEVAHDKYNNIFYIASGQDCDAPATGLILGKPHPPPYGWDFIPDTCAHGCHGAAKWSNVFLGKFGKNGNMIEIINPAGDGPDTTSGAFAVSDNGDVYYGARSKSGQMGVLFCPWPSSPSAFRPNQYDGGQAWFDGCAGRLTNDMHGLDWGSFFGGHHQNNPFGGAVNEEYFTVVGYTKASDFPVYNAIQSNFGGDHDWFITKFNSDGTGLEWSTYLGGSGYDFAYKTDIDNEGKTWVCGFGGNGFPTTDGSKISNQSSVVVCISSDGKKLEESTTKFGGQEATAIATIGDFVIVAIKDGNDAKLFKFRKPIVVYSTMLGNFRGYYGR